MLPSGASRLGLAFAFILQFSPTIFLFFLSFSLLVAFIPLITYIRKHSHMIFTVLLSALPSAPIFLLFLQDHILP